MLLGTSSTVYTVVLINVYFVPTEAVIGFVPSQYSVTEGVNQLANLNVELISGQLGREVLVILNTRSGTAISK